MRLLKNAETKNLSIFRLPTSGFAEKLLHPTLRAVELRSEPFCFLTSFQPVTGTVGQVASYLPSPRWLAPAPRQQTKRLTVFHSIVFQRSPIALLLLVVGLVSPAYAKTEPEDEAPVADHSLVKIQPQSAKPTVISILPVDEAHAFFLTKRGEIGAAKFSPGLSLIGWEFYSEIKWNALPSLSPGLNYSTIIASPHEVTQAFDSGGNGTLDFFQTLIDDWPGKDRGAVITAGPITDPHGRLLFAISAPKPPPSTSSTEGETTEPPAPEKARILAWHPQSDSLITITESQLPIASFSVSREGLLAARLVMSEYGGGYFLFLSDLPPFDPAQPAAAPDPVPFSIASLLIPSELTQKKTPTQLSFFKENGVDKVAVVCPGAKQLLEVVPTQIGGVWGGSVVLREAFESPIDTVVEMKAGSLLAGGEAGFKPLGNGSDHYRITSLNLAPNEDGLELNLSREVDRYEAIKPENYHVQALSLSGGSRDLAVEPIIEADGETILLKTDPLPNEVILRVVCLHLPSMDGEKLLSNAAFYTFHKSGRQPDHKKADSHTREPASLEE